MNAYQFAAWGMFLMLQNASFTFVSRARNSGSYALHAVAALCSNGVWFATQLVSLGMIIDVIKTGTIGQKMFMLVFYTGFTVSGSLLMHWIGITYIEKGNRRVGASR